VIQRKDMVLNSLGNCREGPGLLVFVSYCVHIVNAITDIFPGDGQHGTAENESVRNAGARPPPFLTGTWDVMGEGLYHQV
jgi:hypothetical protein